MDYRIHTSRGSKQNEAMMKLANGATRLYEELGRQKKFLLEVADERSQPTAASSPISLGLHICREITTVRFAGYDVHERKPLRGGSVCAHALRDETRHRLTGKIRHRGRIGGVSLWWNGTHLRIPSTVIHVVIVDRTHGPWRGPNSIFSYSNPSARTARCVRPIFAPRFTRSRPGAPYRFYRFARIHGTPLCALHRDGCFKAKLR